MSVFEMIVGILLLISPFLLAVLIQRVYWWRRHKTATHEFLTRVSPSYNGKRKWWME